MTIAVTRGAEGLERRAFTFADVDMMIEIGVIHPDEKFELVEGEIVPVSPKNILHANAGNRLNRYLCKVVPEDIEIGVENTLQLDDKTFFEPVFVLYRQDGSNRPGAKQTLLVIEVSDSSMRYDLGLKARLMAKYGVREYWVVAPGPRQIHVHRGPGPEGFASVVVVPAGEAARPEHPDLAMVQLKLDAIL